MDHLFCTPAGEEITRCINTYYPISQRSFNVLSIIDTGFSCMFTKPSLLVHPLAIQLEIPNEE